MVTTIFSVIVIVREKTGGMLERLFATPLAPLELVLGHAAALSLVAVLQSTVILGAAILLFQIQIAGNVVLAFAVLLLFAVGNQGLGMVASAAARNELQAVQFIPLVLFPSILLTGVFYPLEAIPGGLRPLSWFVPLTYANDALHSIMLRGWGAGDVGLDLIILAAYAAASLLAAAVFIRRQA
jgi:ABC-2 type transport system permease protein